MNEKTAKKIRRMLARMPRGAELFDSVKDRYIKLPSTARADFLAKLDKQTQKKNPFSNE